MSQHKKIWLNRLLALVILTLTVKALYGIATIQMIALKNSHFSPLLLLDLIVPMVNFYVLNKVIRRQRQGYQYMAVLGLLALLRPENQGQPELSLYLAAIALSALLLLRGPKARKK